MVPEERVEAYCKYQDIDDIWGVHTSPWDSDREPSTKKNSYSVERKPREPRILLQRSNEGE
jgi:hypothetical protein